MTTSVDGVVLYDVLKKGNLPRTSYSFCFCLAYSSLFVYWYIINLDQCRSAMHQAFYSTAISLKSVKPPP